jgi:hypothetical protein
VATGVFTSLFAVIAATPEPEMFERFGAGIYDDPVLAGDFQSGFNTGYVIGIFGMVAGARTGGGGPGSAATAILPTKPGQLGHIFRNAAGHLPDTPANRQLLTDVASNAANRIGVDRFGNVWSTFNRADGTQVWVSTRNGVIQNGGLNQVPQAFPNIVGP